MAGKHTETVQDESQATYEGWCRDAESKINWANHSTIVYNLIRLFASAWRVDDFQRRQVVDL